MSKYDQTLIGNLVKDVSSYENKETGSLFFASSIALPISECDEQKKWSSSEPIYADIILAGHFNETLAQLGLQKGDLIKVTGPVRAKTRKDDPAKRNLYVPVSAIELVVKTKKNQVAESSLDSPKAQNFTKAPKGKRVEISA